MPKLPDPLRTTILKVTGTPDNQFLEALSAQLEADGTTAMLLDALLEDPKFAHQREQILAVRARFPSTEDPSTKD